ncbi:hypothetical protein C1H46_003840 [Malus baccata]|uniref:Uncharacterized protein n=1 Tax=Malus baccata TaxID=106549 RepID=A0A540NHS8_MALBA|nr:hypothetical protein C1H46_003840 [Malus baccata]
MVSSRLIRLFFLCTQILLLIINVNFTQALLGPRDVPIFHCSNNKGNYTTGSTYQTNLNCLLFDLHSYNNGYGFFNSSRGENIDRVYAIVLCRGLIKEDICSKCLTDAANYLREHCTNQKEATGWQNDCMLRYSNRSIYGMMETNPDLYLKDVETLSVSTGLDAFSQESSHLLNRLGQKAATGGDLRKFATGNASLPSSDITIYGLVQCTPELSEQSCIDCLNYTFGMFGSCCSVSVGVRIVKPSCGSRYEIYPFFNDTTETPPANTANPGGLHLDIIFLSHRILRKKSNTSQTVIITVVTVVISLLLIISICIYSESEEDEGKTWSFWFHIASLSCKEADEILDTEALQFNLGSIRTATNNFSEANKFGRGGFGAVYRGRFLNQEDIAVKRLSKDSAQGDIEFKNEVTSVAKFQHFILVRLLGFCLEGNERLLIYEFVPNASLDHFIFGRVGNLDFWFYVEMYYPTRRTHLDWDSRYKIIFGIGRGLLYLHEDSRLKIIHRDLKASNILLDVEMQPKIADFGMATLFDLDQTQGDTSQVWPIISNFIGYMAPEYVMRGHFSVKSNVYSFGVLILEIITGQKNSSFRHSGNVEDLLSYAWKSWKEDTASNLIDPMLKSGSIPETMRCIHIGLLCVQQNIADRPTMAAVIHMLTSYSLDLPVPSQPAFFIVGSDVTGVQGLNQSRSSSIQQSVNEVSTTISK